ncbi:glucan ABC transporter ATP-binding protein/ permease [Tahibacter soli]|uniref:Glucan ABC transporter ATP-binding protein/ permease n=1 Tax=Tahibacter soli TaxID=2983605 RepID=A0A9X4BI13_9GAMM|nr:glucan ABC transporter ATP-binding protein/ permease [Tahibacter soli]MDC8014775.1 glucan ABC transporter ATP-binding protein/ permease [Tahibacter soli]
MFKIYLRVIGLLAPEKGLAATLAIANLALAGVFFLEPWLFGRVVDALAGTERHDAWRLIGLWAAVGFGGVIASVWVSLYADRLAHRRRLAAIASYFEHAIALPLSFHGEHHTGRLLRIMHGGASNLFGLWLGFFREHLATLLAILVMVPLALTINWKLALLMIGLMVSFAVFNAIAMRRTHKAQGEVEELHHAISERAGDVFGNVSVVQSFTRLSSEVAHVRGMMSRVLAAQYPVLRGWAVLSVLNRAASTLTIIAIFALGASLNAKGEVTVGQIVSFVGFAMMLIGRLEQFAGFISGLFFQTHSLNDFFRVLDTRLANVDKPGAPDLVAPRGEVAFENVSFGYDPAQPALRNLSFRVRAGGTVALVGPTGAGKTTALSLLYRAYDPSEGRITVDGVDIRDVGIDSLRRNISVVFQDPGLFYRSIADNLRIGKPDATDADIEAAARAAEAHRFVSAKPDGYATLVAERGRSLSGGERQRLAIARAMLKDAPILILDEATSALDNATEARIQRALGALTKNRTTFVIAHRLTTVRNADLILVLKDGELVEQGRYAELVAQGGLFAELDGQGRFVEDAVDDGSEEPAVLEARAA